MDSRRAAVHVGTDRCPGVLRLHEAADGLLARVRLPGGRIDARGLAVVAAVARQGNGLVELTSRASLQVRGLGADVGERAAKLLRAGGLLPSAPHDRVRNVLASPLAGRHPRSRRATDDVVAALDRALCGDPGLAALPGRFLFAVDDATGMAHADRADVAIVAGSSGAFRLWLAGARTSLAAPAADAPALALEAARAFLRLRAGDGSIGRLASVEDGPASVARSLGGELAPAGPARPASRLAMGVFCQADNLAAVTVLAPLGRLERDAVAKLASRVEEVRLSTARTLTIVDVEPCDVMALVADLAALGLVTSAESGWHGLSACSGLGACARARVDVRAAAAERAAVRGADAPAEHWSACERCCGRPADVAVAVVATADGVLVETPGAAREADDVAGAVALLGDGR